MHAFVLFRKGKRAEAAGGGGATENLVESSRSLFLSLSLSLSLPLFFSRTKKWMKQRQERGEMGESKGSTYRERDKEAEIFMNEPKDKKKVG